MNEILGLNYTPIHWHFWLGVSIPFIVTLIIMMNRSGFYHQLEGQITLVIAQIVLSSIFYFGLGILFYYLGVI